MDANEKKAAQELLEALQTIPDDGRTYVRGYLQGRIDGIKSQDKDTDE